MRLKSTEDGSSASERRAEPDSLADSGSSHIQNRNAPYPAPKQLAVTINEMWQDSAGGQPGRYYVDPTCASHLGYRVPYGKLSCLEENPVLGFTIAGSIVESRGVTLLWKAASARARLSRLPCALAQTL
jgi:hypothetical protein